MAAHTNSFVIEEARVYRHGGNTDDPPVQSVLISNGRIEYIGDAIPSSNDVRRIKLDNHMLVPGFVNGHSPPHDVLEKGMFEAMSLERGGQIAGAMGRNQTADEVLLRTT